MSRLSMGLVASVVLALTLGSTAKADSIKVYYLAGQFPANDFVHWEQLGAEGTIVSTPYSVITVNNFPGVTLKTSNGGSVERLTECPATPCGWTGNFAPGTALLWTNPNGAGTGNGPLTLTFSTPIDGLGFQIQPDYGYLPSSEFEAEFVLYGKTGNLLGDEVREGTWSQTENNTAVFLGLSDLTGANIYSVQLGIYNQNCALNCKDFAIGWLDLDTKAPTVPEPGTLMLLSSGFAVLGFLRRKLS